MASFLKRLLSVLLLAGASSQEMPWYQAVSMFHFPKVVASEFGETNSHFLPLVSNSSADFVLVDFYAPWCPHCQHFAPEFERLALAIQRQSLTPHPRVLAATVDCVQYANTCNDWNINFFPTLLWGSKADWLSKDIKRLQMVQPTSPSAEGVADWINYYTPIKVHPHNVSRQEITAILDTNMTKMGVRFMVSARPQMTSVDPWDLQLATALLVHETLARHRDSQSSLSTLRDFIELLQHRFPESPEGAGPKGICQSSLVHLGQELSSAPDPDDLEDRWQLCNTPWARYGKRSWRSCRGTWPGKRGFTCGLWSLFHTVVARGDDHSALQDTKTIRAVIGQLFDCQDCRNHFLQIPWTENSTQTRRDAQLWWWQAHNQVNSHVQQLELQYQDADPEFPKIQWPAQAQCRDCQAPAVSSFLSRAQAGSASVASQGTWRLNKVAQFLDQFYGA